jgi:hypothetical protein
VIAGKLDGSHLDNEDLEFVVAGEGDEGPYEKKFNLCFLRPLPIEVDGLPFPGNRTNCIFPPILPRPEPEKSAAQNFIERLWAFLTIKNLLDEKASEKERRISELTEDDADQATTTEAAEVTAMSSRRSDGAGAAGKSRKERATELAIKYNFVTKLTSLVVSKPPPAGEKQVWKTLYYFCPCYFSH